MREHKQKEDLLAMNEFLIFYAPFLIVAAGIFFLFYWGARTGGEENHNGKR